MKCLSAQQTKYFENIKVWVWNYMTKINLNKNQSIILASLVTVVPKQRRRLKSHYHPLDKPKPLYEKLLIN